MKLTLTDSDRRLGNEPFNLHPAARENGPLAALSRPPIQLDGVTKIYKTAAGDFAALQNVSLEVQPGEFLAILGRSGAGKTTLVNLITGVDHPTRGQIWVAGEAVHALDENRLALWRGKNIGLVYQSFHLMPTLSLLDNVLLPMDFSGLYQGRRSRERAMALLDMVGLADHALKLPSAISGGQQQRAAIARALANDPALIVADEPTGRLDSTTAESIFQIFTRLVEEGKTIVMVTHDEDFARRASRVVYLEDGEFIDGPAG
jgi:ABC-type lipoprotein export system ATPase subunit